MSRVVSFSSSIPVPFDAEIGITSIPILFDNFSSKLTNYNMVIFGKSGAGKSVTVKMLSARSSILMGIDSLALDAER